MRFAPLRARARVIIKPIPGSFSEGDMRMDLGKKLSTGAAASDYCHEAVDVEE